MVKMKANSIFMLLIYTSIIPTFLVSCKKTTPASPEATAAFGNIIPKPVSAETTGNAFLLNDGTAITVASEALLSKGEFLAGRLRPATGFPFPVTVAGTASNNGIHLTLEGGDETWGEEGYRLTVADEGATLVANTPAGITRGIQTIRQLLPAGIEMRNVQRDNWEMATGTITDYPEFGWRGSMLDVARHFFTVDEVKRYIDLISYYKLNVLHLHLTDDQGWRIEIKSWPKLTEVGGKFEVGGTNGGFYTQEDYKQIVDYAASQNILIVPEIDMPGHINSALVSYKELNVGPSFKIEPGGPPRPVAGEPHFGIEVGFSTLDIRKDVTFQFVNDVLRELSAITPGPYLHIGGDEASVTKKEDYIQFVNRFKDIVESNGKIMIGWEEIAQGDLDSSVLVQYWHSDDYAKMAAQKGAKLILSPSKKVYLDMQYDSTTRLGLHWAAYIEVDSSYQWNPAAYIDELDREQIVGVEAPLWSETLETMDDVEYMLFPRITAVAEVSWSAPSKLAWEGYKERLADHARRFDAMEIDYYPSDLIPWKD